jgi:hypothetical protein
MLRRLLWCGCLALVVPGPGLAAQDAPPPTIKQDFKTAGKAVGKVAVTVGHGVRNGARATKRAFKRAIKGGKGGPRKAGKRFPEGGEETVHGG